jgi:hypothetical protein
MLVKCDCGKSLNLAEKYAGKRVRCPGCNEVLQVPDEEGVVEEAVAKSIKKKQQLQAKPEPDTDEDRPQPRRKAKAQPSFMSQYGLYLGIAGGAIVVGVVVLVIVLMRNRSDDNKGPAVTDNSGDVKPSGPRGPVPSKDGDQPNKDRLPRPKDQRPPVDNPGTREEPAINLTVEKLCKDVASDNAAAIEKYHGKKVVVDGTVESVLGREVSPDIVVVCQVPGLESIDVRQRPTLSCRMVGAAAQAARLVKGQQVKIKGRCEIRSRFVMVLDSELISAAANPTLSVTASQLTKQYTENKQAADQKFLEKSVIVEGIVAAVVPQQDSVYLEGFDEKAAKPVRVQCGYSGFDRATYKALQKGQSVQILGVCTGYLKLLDEQYIVTINAKELLKK